MMLEHYVKLFHLTWIKPWIVEALVMIVGALVLVFVVCKAMDWFNGESK